MEIREGPASVPARAWVVEGPDGEPCVDWGGGRVEPSDGNVLVDFAKLAAADREEAGEAVAAFVRAYGPLHLCAEHRREFLGPGGHGRCTLLKPEPVRVWLDHARGAALVLSVKESLQAGETPDPHGLQGREPDPNVTLDHLRLDVEKFRRERGATFEEISELWEEIEEWEGEAQEVAQKRVGLRAQLREYQPASAAGWWEWLAHEVNRGLGEYPPFLHLEASPGSGGVRPVLQTIGLLPRIYMALAFEVSGVGQLASCSHCGRFYAPNRAPKHGQRNYCPECREAHVPQRLHMRERRAQ